MPDSYSNYTNTAATTAAVTNRFVASTNMKVGAYTVANPSPVWSGGCHVTVTGTQVGGVDDTLGTVVFVGTDLNGQAITETLTPVNGSTVEGTKIFRTVTSVTGVGWVINTGNDTLVCGAAAGSYAASGTGILGAVIVNNSVAAAITISDARGTIMTVPASQAAGTFYPLNVQFAGYLKVATTSTNDVTVTHTGSAGAVQYATSRPMAHVYASLADAKEFARDEGTAWASGSTNDRRALAILESVSRRVDEWCGRSAFGSGFGPRTGTNRYDGAGGNDLDFRDDLISATTVTRRASTAAATTSTLAANTDYYLRNQRVQYEPAPYRTMILHGQGVATFGTGFRVTDILGSWGYQSVTRTLTATTAEALDDSETGIDLSSGALTEISPGMTLLLDSEQVYVRATTSGTPDVATVDRGQNGTTAASHLTSLAIAKYVYDPAVVDATLRLWGRRWAARSAGADGADGGGQMGVVNPRESEDTILRRTVGHLRLQTLVATS